MKALACASYDYMKLMVSELQRQLDEATGNLFCHLNEFGFMYDYHSIAVIPNLFNLVNPYDLPVKPILTPCAPRALICHVI